jgi:hypothetical protein
MHHHAIGTWVAIWTGIFVALAGSFVAILVAQSEEEKKKGP